MMTEKIVRMQTEFASIPAPDTLIALIKEREQIQKDIAAAQTELNILDANITHLQRNIERKGQSVARLLKTNAETSIADKNRVRILAHAAKVQDTLKQFGLAPFQWTVSRLSFSTRDSRRCGNCGSRVAASKRLWESRSDFQGLVSFHNN